MINKEIKALVEGYGKDLKWLEEAMSAVPEDEEIIRLNHPYPDVWRYWPSIEFMSGITSGRMIGYKRFMVIRDYLAALQAVLKLSRGKERKVIGNLPPGLIEAIKETHFTAEDVWRAQHFFEKVTEHDTAAAGDYLKVLLARMYPRLASHVNAVYFAATSEDIMSIVFGLTANELIYGHYIPKLLNFCDWLPLYTGAWRSKNSQSIVLPALTHEQIAEPTTWLIKMATSISGILTPISKLQVFEGGNWKFSSFSGKFGGGVGNNITLFAAYPKIDWWSFCQRFVEGYGLHYDLMTNQSSTYVWDAENFKSIANTITQLIKFAQDFIGLTRAPGQFLVKEKKRGAKGSSLMPNKSNPWEAEGAIAMMKESRLLINFLAEELQTYPDEGNMKRSYLFRCLGKYMAGAFMGLKRVQNDVSKFHPDVRAVLSALNAYPGITGSAIQTKMKQLGFPGDAYRAIQSCALLSDGTSADHEYFIANLDIVLGKYGISATQKDKIIKLMNPWKLVMPAEKKARQVMEEIKAFIADCREILKNQFKERYYHS